MTDYKEKLIQAYNTNNTTAINQIAEEAFRVSKDEDLLAFVAGSMYDQKISTCPTYLTKFIDLFPNSLHGIRIFRAHILSSQNKHDMVSTEARIYLRIIVDMDKLNTDSKIIQDSLSSGFLLLTSSYTQNGARSYSIRVLELASKFTTDYWKQIYKEEIERLNQELLDSENKIQDEKWEAFFKFGYNADELYYNSKNNGYPDLAQRIDLLEGNFRFNKDFKIDNNEIFRIVYGNGNGYLLN